MLLLAIVACEVGFWLLLGAGLLCRYLLRRPKLGAWLLALVPVVDLVLLVLTVLDLRQGGRAEFAHGLAAVYLGFSAVFGPSMVRWADVRFAQRWAGGPPPAPKPAGGTWARAHLEWRDFGRAVLAAGLSMVLLLAAIVLVGARGDTTELWQWLPRLGLVLAVWLVGWPLWDSVRAFAARKS